MTAACPRGKVRGWTAALLPLLGAASHTTRIITHHRLGGSLVALLPVLLFGWAASASAAATNDPAAGPIPEGRELVQKMLAQQPDENFTNTGTLKIRDATGKRFSVPVEFDINCSPTDWRQSYQAFFTNGTETLTVTHLVPPSSQAPVGAAAETCVYCPRGGQPRALSPADANLPFAGSEFSVADLHLAFLHWPQQTVVKKEFHRECACMVLESTCPQPAAGGYQRVVSWIDEESLGIVEAYAYDANGQKLKNFYPKSFEKINGRYQLESMVMENLQTGARSVFEFVLHK